MEHLVIAGGTSFIARHLLRRIDKTKYRVTALVRHLPPEKIDGVTYVCLALAEYDKLPAYVPQCDIYLPFVWDGTRKAAREAEEVNEASYRAVFQSIQAMIRQCGCKKIILPGTCHEYKNTGCPSMRRRRANRRATMECTNIACTRKRRRCAAKRERRSSRCGCFPCTARTTEGRKWSIHGCGNCFAMSRCA